MQLAEDGLGSSAGGGAPARRRAGPAAHRHLSKAADSDGNAAVMRAACGHADIF